MKKIGHYRARLIDIEGVLVRDKRYQPIAGSVEWLNRMVRTQMPFCLVSNNTTHRPGELVAGLQEIGFEISMDHLVGVLGLGSRWLQENGHRRLLWLGTARLADFWRDEGFDLVEDGPCDAVVLGVNPELTVKDMDRALDPIVEGGADLVCLHRNLFYLDAEGRRRLGPGTWAAALEALGGAGQVVTIGKPSPAIYDDALKRVGVQAQEALFISDDPIADLVTAGRLGMGTAFVLSGKYPDHEVLGRLDQEDWPDIICALPADLQQEGDL